MFWDFPLVWEKWTMVWPRSNWTTAKRFPVESTILWDSRRYLFQGSKNTSTVPVDNAEKFCSSNPYGGVSSDNHLLVACDSGAALKSSQINIIFFGCLEQEERVRTLYSRYTQYSSPPDIQKESAKKITLNLKHHNFEYKIQKSNSKTII